MMRDLETQKAALAGATSATSSRMLSDSRHRNRDELYAQPIFDGTKFIGHIAPERCCNQHRAITAAGEDLGLYGSEIAAAHALLARRGARHA